MARKTLYIAKSDLTLWEAVERVADKAGTSISRVVLEAVQRDLPRQDAEADAQPADPWAHIAADAA